MAVERRSMVQVERRSSVVQTRHTDSVDKAALNRPLPIRFSAVPRFVQELGDGSRRVMRRKSSTARLLLLAFDASTAFANSACGSFGSAKLHRANASHGGSVGE